MAASAQCPICQQPPRHIPLCVGVTRTGLPCDMCGDQFVIFILYYLYYIYIYIYRLPCRHWFLVHDGASSQEPAPATAAADLGCDQAARGRASSTACAKCPRPQQPHDCPVPLCQEGGFCLCCAVWPPLNPSLPAWGTPATIACTAKVLCCMNNLRNYIWYPWYHPAWQQAAVCGA